MVKLSILYLDDEKPLLDIFREMFGDLYEVRTAATAAEARRSLADAPADIIISDQKMPDIVGAEFLREAAEFCPDSLRIMLTGHAGVDDMFEEIGSGVIQLFVSKPWQEDQMLEVLARASALLELRRAGKNTIAE